MAKRVLIICSKDDKSVAKSLVKSYGHVGLSRSFSTLPSRKGRWSLLATLKVDPFRAA